MTKKKKKPPFDPPLMPSGYVPCSIIAAASDKLQERCLLSVRSAAPKGKSSSSCPPVTVLEHCGPTLKSTASNFQPDLAASTSNRLPRSTVPRSTVQNSNLQASAAATTPQLSSLEAAPLTPPEYQPPSAANQCASPPAKKWSSFFKDTSSLEKIGTPTTHVSGVPFILIPNENVEAAKEEFKDFIYAHFPGHPPEMGRIIGVINAIWARTGPRIYVHRIGQGSFLLRVSNPRTRAILLSRTLWNIVGHPMCVAPWSPEFTPDNPPLTKAQVMVEFRGIPYLLFNNESLARIASGVGEPKALSPETARKETFEVAKILVEVDLLSELPDKLISGLSNGKEFEVAVSYPWLPPKCDDCGEFGHANSHCPRKPPPIKSRRKPQSRSRSRSKAASRTRGKIQSRPGRSTTPVSSRRHRSSNANQSTMVLQANSPVQDKTSTGEAGASETDTGQLGRQPSIKYAPPKEASDSTPPVHVATLQVQLPMDTSSPAAIASDESNNVDPNSLDKADDLVSLASITVLENMSVVAPTVVTINEKLESPSESAQNASVLDGSKSQAISAAKTVSTRVVEPDFGSNKFASLISQEDEELISPEEDEVLSDSDRETEMDSMDLMTPSGKRFLRERPVKPTAKAKEMYWQSAARGRGRGRGKRGGRG